MEFQSGEVWRASMAIGIPYGKKLYCCPWMQKPWLEYIVGAHSKSMFNCSRKHGAIILIPAAKKEQLLNVPDEYIFLE